MHETAVDVPRLHRPELLRGVGLLVPANGTTYPGLTRVWDLADELGVDFLCVEDHLLPPPEDPEISQLECWSLLAAMAERTSGPAISALVTPVAFRNPTLLARAAATIDQISAGRFVLGVGAGWYEAEYTFAGLPFEPPAARLAQLEDVIARCRTTWSDRRYPPAPVAGAIPVLIGGTGPRMLSLVARVADGWNAGGPLDDWVRHNDRVDAACHAIGRDPGTLARTVVLERDEFDASAAYRRAGADLVVLSVTDRIGRDELTDLIGRAG